MRLAILGATSQIAKDLINILVLDPEIELSLFARNHAALNEWLPRLGREVQMKVKPYGDFETAPSGSFDVVLNFVGSGNPAQTASLGKELWDITQKFDAMAMSYIGRDPVCRYIFISSGAIFGGDFMSPVRADSVACIWPNSIRTDAWYGLAKLNAELLHRRFTDLAIVDVRVFNYFSHSADLEARFLVTDILRSIRDDVVFETSSIDIVRDYIGPTDFSQIIRSILNSQAINVAIDCYTKMPVSKLEMLEVFAAEFGLKYRLIDFDTGLNATGNKVNYYSTNHRANEVFDYIPSLSSLETLVRESREIGMAELVATRCSIR